MTPAQKKEHLKELWRVCYLKAIGASNLKRIFFKLHSRVINFGTTRNINKNRVDIEQKILEKKSKYILMPDGKAKRFWNVLMIFLLLYVATYVPYNICFHSATAEQWGTSEWIDIVVDTLFGMDIIMNFFSSYEDPVT